MGKGLSALTRKLSALAPAFALLLSIRTTISKHIGEIRAALLIILLIASAGWSYCKLETVREGYQSSSVETNEPQQKEDGATIEADNEVCAEILKQADQFRGWSVLVLGGIIALLVTTKVHRTVGVEWAYLPLGPAAIFLVNSLYAGWILTKRYTFLVATKNFSDYDSLSDLLQVQSDLFLNSILCVGLLAGWFLFLIVLGKIEPFETEKKG